MTYIVEACRAGDVLASRSAVTFDASLGYLEELRQTFGRVRYAHFRLFNDDRCDYDPEGGWDDGLTEDEREMIGGRADGC